MEWRRRQHFADTILQQLLASSALSGSDRGFATELFYGVLRNLTLLDFWIDRLRSGRLDANSRDLLRLGLYQLFILRTPGHAAVFETVALANSRSRALINAVLRAALRRNDELLAAADAAPLATRSSHPQFLLDRWMATYGEDATSGLYEWDNSAPPVFARVNLLKITLPDFVAQHPEAEPLTARAGFVRLATIPTEALARGECYIQDPSTSVACELLAPQPGDRVLDACAAPGGKSGLLAQLMENRGLLVACDRDAARVRVLSTNLENLGVAIAQIRQHDWLSADCSLGSEQYDRVLIDAPCTNTGVMRRRVDVRWRLTPADFARMAAEQMRIVAAVLPQLKQGGTLVYSTCSLEPEENEHLVTRLLADYPFLQLAEQHSVLPFRDQFDGAFAAKLIHVG